MVPERQPENERPRDILTKEEVDVLRYVVDGKSLSEIRHITGQSDEHIHEVLESACEKLKAAATDS